MNRELKKMQARTAAKVEAAKKVVRENTKNQTAIIDKMLQDKK